VEILGKMTALYYHVPFPRHMSRLHYFLEIFI
jgi:hypothetical protein